MLDHDTYRNMASRFNTSTASLLRHHDKCLPTSLVTSEKVKEITRNDDLVDRVIELSKITQDILERSVGDQQDDISLKALARAEKQIELQAKLVGLLQSGTTVNLTLSPEWLSIQTVIIQALDPFPDARIAVASALDKTRVVDAKPN